MCMRYMSVRTGVHINSKPPGPGTAEYAQDQGFPPTASQHRLCLPVRTEMFYICRGLICGHVLVGLSILYNIYCLNLTRGLEAMFLERRVLGYRKRKL